MYPDFSTDILIKLGHESNKRVIVLKNIVIEELKNFPVILVYFLRSLVGLYYLQETILLVLSLDKDRKNISVDENVNRLLKL